ncbi:gliding motility-associated protein GldL [Marivirga sericea]|uniref:Gliding motility-associated protein GldL n=1 Tax=Marivirga sericea TaxID=1028 RepID=A0A1X7J069_9BACT|nr:gliding motility protein GldL [Marivirga sericea]SMG21046.1 gliding motility-associated protein GldL [Marivirga sericea]
MSNKKGGFQELLFKTIMPKVYGIGAAIVIIGAMFKILHLPGASFMLGVGLSTEAIIFLLSAFEPTHEEVDWSKVYPELAEEFDEEPAPRKKQISSAGGGSTSQQLDKILEEGKIGPDLIKSLGDGMKSMADSAKQMSNLSNAAVATNDYANNVKQASKSLLEMNKSYDSTVKAMSEMSNASMDAKSYHSQVQAVTKNLTALNQVYEMELQDSQNHVKAMNKFYKNLATALDSMTEASKDTAQFQTEVKNLTTNLSQLNKVYGNMLSAMKG